jgi:Zn-dependent peptidase ImmA (M78 family)/DNA-binding XRE family transcriptional regulator
MENNLYKRIGSRVKRARENLKISQEELARRLGYNSPATISHFETGQRKVSIADLHQLSEVLGTPLEYFFEQEEIGTEMQRFRLRAMEVRPSARESVGAFLAFAHKHSRKSSKIPSDIREKRPGVAAEIILNLTDTSEPPINPNHVAKSLNVPVFNWDFPDEVSGIYVVEEDASSIGVNQSHPSVRQRFTIAHELGHLLYHKEDSLFVDFLDTEMAQYSYNDEQREQETKANQFAADLLMPKKWIKKDFDKYGADGLVLLAQRYEVSEQALWFRLLNLKLVERDKKILIET